MSETERVEQVPAGRLSELPKEVIESQKARSDLLKWKFVVCAAVGAFAMGFPSNDAPDSFVLSLIPPACAYIDLLSAHLTIRQLVIGAYFRNLRRDGYESFAQRVRGSFSLENLAVYASTLVACVVIVVVACFTGSRDGQLGSALLLLSGSLGLVATLATYLLFLSKVSTLERMAPLDTPEPRSALLHGLVKNHYSSRDIALCRARLTELGALRMDPAVNGVFPAASMADATRSGYENAWVRDNVHVIHALVVAGDKESAVRSLRGLLDRYRSVNRRRITHLLNGWRDRPDDPDVSFCLAIRFPAVKGRVGDWNHDQNDAHGYLLWIFFELLASDATPFEWETVVAVLKYLKRKRFWSASDTGHWEEGRRLSAASVGTVYAGLKLARKSIEARPVELVRLCEVNQRSVQELERDVVFMIHQAEAMLNKTLPFECRLSSPNRRFDSSLLFLLYPLKAIDAEGGGSGTVSGRQILADVRRELLGVVGIRRYNGDSYWCADYKRRVNSDALAANVNGHPEGRDRLLRPGEEAQWCIFDSILCAIYGDLFERRLGEGDTARAWEALALQDFHFSRSICQICDLRNREGAVACPEAYYLCDGRYIPNDHTPLLWAQANLICALHSMERSHRIAESDSGFKGITEIFQQITSFFRGLLPRPHWD